jgi:aminopeptidase N
MLKPKPFLYLILGIFIFITSPISSVFGQNFSKEDCIANPSCRANKAMLNKSVQLWDALSPGINYNSRSDSFDIHHYSLELDMTAIKTLGLSGHCKITYQALIPNATSITFDLLQLQVDSVLADGLLGFKYNDTLLQCYFSESINLQQIHEISIFYRGQPIQDASWGGFYRKDNYAYNMGVGFASDPHNYGRVWHPCFDNFKEKARYTFKVKAKDNQRAHCNGRMLSERIVDGTNTRVWQLDEAIPTYLASIALGDYTTIQKQHKGAFEDVAIELAAASEDTARLNKSFIHLPKAIDAYEYWFGPHRWSKVGFTLVPFHSGAMEHATNISYPIYAVDGTLQRERLMAHELGHSWWGNLVTCASAKDMWINEGMASYAVHLFSEYTYGKKNYLRTVQQNHYQVLRRAHIVEKGYRPVAEVPHRYTYGMHVYDKGAVIAHNLRTYMGDSLFRIGLQYITQNYAFKNINTFEFRDALSYASGLDLDAFFEDWLFLGGFPHFEIDQYQIDSSSSKYKLKLVFRQKLLGRDKMMQDVPIEISCFGPNQQKIILPLRLNASLDTHIVQLPFVPQNLLLNERHQLNQARYDFALEIAPNSMQQELKLPAWIRISTPWLKSSVDTASIHLAYHPVAPNPRLSSTVKSISKQHYWSINGNLPLSTEIYASLIASYKQDTQLLQSVESIDSMVLLYRSNPNEKWREHPNYIKKKGIKQAFFRFAVLRGDYTFGCCKKSAKRFNANTEVFGQAIPYRKENQILKVELKANKRSKACLELSNTASVSVHRQCIRLSTTAKKFAIATADLQPGLYFINLRTNDGRLLRSQRVVL